MRHRRRIGLDVPGFLVRLHCYQLHVGLTHLAFSAFAGVEEDLAGLARRTAAVLVAAPRR